MLAIPPDKVFSFAKTKQKLNTAETFYRLNVNIVEKHQANNSRCFVVSAAHTDQFKNFYFVKRQ